MTSGDDLGLVRVSVAICLGRWQLLRELRRELSGEPDRAFREALLQCHLFAGFPRVVEACGILSEEGGLGTPDGEEVTPEPDRFEAGRELFDAIYGDHADRVRGQITAAHPVLAAWIEGHAYGRVLARGGLEPARREVLSVACLAALGQDRQLASHVRGAIRLGATEAQLRAALAEVADLIEPDHMRRAERVVERFAG